MVKQTPADKTQTDSQPESSSNKQSDMQNDIHIDARRLETLFKNMVDIYSPHGKEQEISQFLFHYLKKHGLPVIRQEVEDDRENILVIPDNEDAQFVLMGHIDTIPAPDFENYKFTQDPKDKDRISGLGSADMKSGCAAMIEAYISRWKTDPKTMPAALALVVGEEESGDGTQMFLSEYHFPYAVIGEPTDLHPCFSHNGYIEASISTTGTRKHASLASSSVNAIEEMLKVLLKIIAFLRSKNKEVVYNIRNLSSSHTGFAVPDFCEVSFDFHLTPHSSLGNFIYDLEEIVDKERRGNTGFNGSIVFNYLHAGYELPLKGNMFSGLKSIYESLGFPFEPMSFRSHSDANLLWEAGIRPILIGPGQLEEAHTADESVSFKQILEAARIYARLLHLTGILDVD